MISISSHGNLEANRAIKHEFQTGSMAGKVIAKLQLQAAESSRTCPIRSGGNGQHPTASVKYHNYFCLAESTSYYWVLFGPGSFWRKKVGICSYPYPDSCMNHLCLMGWSLTLRCDHIQSSLQALTEHSIIIVLCSIILISAMFLGITGEI